MPLDTLANVKTSLLITGSTDDALLTRLLEAADSFIAEYTSRAFAGGSFTELHPAGHELVFLRNFPVDTLTSLKVDAARLFGPETVRPIDTFVVHSARGVIESIDGPFLKPRAGHTDDWPAALQVIYSTATGQVPAAVREAFCQLVGHLYRFAKTSPAQSYEMLTRKVDASGEKEWPWSLATGEPLPRGVLEMLEPYRVPAA
jgi:hypothetical protein